MDLEKLIAFLKEKEASEEVLKFVEGLKPVTSETVKDFIENNDEGKKLLMSLTDAKVSKSIESWKANNLQKVLDDEIAKRYPPESEDAKKLRELEKKQNDLLAELKRKDLLNAAIKEATVKGLPVDIVDRFLGDDEEGTKRNISLFEEHFKRAVEAQVSDKFKQGGREPGANASAAPPPAGTQSELTKALLELV